MLPQAVQARTPGDQLREMRIRLGMTTRDVDQLSRKVAADKGNEDYVVSHARLVQIENGESTPSVYKLYSLSAVYGCRITALLDLYLDLDDLGARHMSLEVQATHPVNFGPHDNQTKMSFPVRFDPGFDLQKSGLVSRMVELWGEVPVGMLQHLNLRKGRWGLIGLGDYTMYPLLRPGSLVQIDDNPRPAVTSAHRNEYERPIYFLELRDGYVCSWCEFHKNRIVSVPHPLAPVSSREFAYPAEAEIVGRVTAVAARIVGQPPTSRANGQHSDQRLGI